MEKWNLVKRSSQEVQKSDFDAEIIMMRFFKRRRKTFKCKFSESDSNVERKFKSLAEEKINSEVKEG